MYTIALIHSVCVKLTANVNFQHAALKCSVDSEFLVSGRLLQCCAPLRSKLQHKEVAASTEAPRQSHVSPLLRTLHWLPIQQRIDYKVALPTFKVGSTSTPSYLRLQIQDQEHGHNLRSTNTVLRQPFTTTTFAKRTFRCSAPAVWNSQPKTVLNSDSFAVFKSGLKTFLFSQAFSSFSAH